LILYYLIFRRQDGWKSITGFREYAAALLYVRTSTDKELAAYFEGESRQSTFAPDPLDPTTLDYKQRRTALFTILAVALVAIKVCVIRGALLFTISMCGLIFAWTMVQTLSTWTDFSTIEKSRIKRLSRDTLPKNRRRRRDLALCTAHSLVRVAPMVSVQFCRFVLRFYTDPS